MIKTREDKKRDILKFLEQKISSDEWFDVTEEEILKNFVDMDFDETDIENILGELEKQGTIIIDEIKLSIHYPKRFKEKVKEKFGKITLPSFFNIYLIGFLFVFILSGWITNWAVKNTTLKTPNDFLILGILVGIVGAYIIGYGYYRILNRLSEKLDIVKKYAFFIYPVFIIFISGVALAVFAGVITNGKITIDHILLIFGTSIVGGFAFVKLTKK